MKKFGGPAVLLDKDDINTDEIIPAKYLTEITKTALKPHLLEDLLIDGKAFDNRSSQLEKARAVVSRRNFGCGSSREHAVWAFEVNGIDVIIAESFARIFRQNMFNCGILAIELPKEDIDRIFSLEEPLTVEVDLPSETVTLKSMKTEGKLDCAFQLNPFDRDLVDAGGWLAYADQRY